MSRKALALIVVGLLGIPYGTQAETVTLVYASTHQGFPELLREHALREDILLDLVHVDTISMRSELLRRASVRELPDAVIMASDNLGNEMLAFSVVPGDLLSPDIDDRVLSMVRRGDAVYGIPVLAGNHQMLFYNRSLVSQPPTRIEEMLTWKSGGRSIVWDHSSMYFFLPFVLAADPSFLIRRPLRFDTPEMIAAIGGYVDLGRELDLGSTCGYACVLQIFEEEKAACLIDGDWDIARLRRRLGENLGVAPLPSFRGRSLRSVSSAQVLAFPNLSLQGEKRQALATLARCVQSESFQRAVREDLGTIPVSRHEIAVLASEGDEVQKASLAVFESADPMSIESTMPVAWGALLKGYERHATGMYDATKTASYMQHLFTTSTSAKAMRSEP